MLEHLEKPAETALTFEDNPMRNKHRKVKMNIKGRFKKMWGDYLLRRKLRSLGVDLHNMEHHSNNHVEVHIGGEMDNLWEVVNWTKGGRLFFRMREILVEFVD
jgi:hypothetical protein